MFSIRSKLAAGAVLVALISGVGPAAARTTPESFADLAEAVLPAVVNISTTQTLTAESGDLQEFEDLFRDFFDKQNPNRPQGPRRSTSLGCQNVWWVRPSASSTA